MGIETQWCALPNPGKRYWSYCLNCFSSFPKECRQIKLAKVCKLNVHGPELFKAFFKIESEPDKKELQYKLLEKSIEGRHEFAVKSLLERNVNPNVQYSDECRNLVEYEIFFHWFRDLRSLNHDYQDLTIITDFLKHGADVVEVLAFVREGLAGARLSEVLMQFVDDKEKEAVEKKVVALLKKREKEFEESFPMEQPCLERRHAISMDGL